MRGIGKQALTIFLASILVSLPVSGSASGNLIGVAQGTALAGINGQPLHSQASVFSGDQIQTGEPSRVTVICAPQERIHLAANTLAQFVKDNRATIVRLEIGAVEFQTEGNTGAVIGPSEVQIRPTAGTLTIAQVARLADGRYQVSIREGSVEVSDAEQTVHLGAGRAALIASEESAAPPAQAPGTAKGKRKGVVILIVAALNAAAIAIPLALEQTKSVSPIVP